MRFHLSSLTRMEDIVVRGPIEVRVCCRSSAQTSAMWKKDYGSVAIQPNTAGPGGASLARRRKNFDRFSPGKLFRARAERTPWRRGPSRKLPATPWTARRDPDGSANIPIAGTSTTDCAKAKLAIDKKRACFMACQ
jgi:hypothetical protein